MKLVYWVAECLDDSKCYNVRARTKREAIIIRDEKVGQGMRYGPVFKMTVHYSDAFNLIFHALGEGGIYERPKSNSSE